jgi:hypothetical protein
VLPVGFEPKAVASLLDQPYLYKGHRLFLD